MNKHNRLGALVPETVTTGPLPGSRKIYCHPQGQADIRVPFREVILQEGADEPPVRIYDPSGPYTESDARIDLAKGLQRVRDPWIARRAGIEAYDGRAVLPQKRGVAGSEGGPPPSPANMRPRRG